MPASTSARYKCELTRNLTSIQTASGITNSDYMSIDSWSWLSGGPENVLVADASSISLKSRGENAENPLAFSGESKTHSGQIKYISSFLRMKDGNDPFTDSFCVHLSDGQTFVLRGSKFFSVRYLLEPKGYIEFSNFRKIKIKSFDDLKVFISVDDSYIPKYEAMTPTALRPLQNLNSMSLGLEVRGRIISIDPPNVWLTILGRTSTKIVPLVFHRWGLCDKRRIGTGAVVVIKNFHFQNDVIGCCPARTSLVIESLPPIATGVVGIHTLSSSSVPDRCFVHNVDGVSECRRSNIQLHKLSINSLCACDCFIACRNVDDKFIKELSQLSSQVKIEDMIDEQEAPRIDERYNRRLKEELKTAIQEAEVCLSLLKLDQVWHQQAPSFFNTRIEEPLEMKSLGAPTAEVTEQLKSLSKPLYLSLFPPNRPLNAFVLFAISDANGQEFNLLVPRDVSVDANMSYSVTRMLVLSTDRSVAVHGILMTDADISICARSHPISPTTGVMSPSKTKLSRRMLLSKRLQEM